MGIASDIYDRVWETMEAQDWPAFLSLFDPDVHLIFQDGEYQGLDAARMYFGAVMEMFPDIRHSISSVVERADGSAMAGWVTAEATGTGDRVLFGTAVPAKGKRMFFEAVDFLFFRDGLITEWRAMLDLESHVREMGVNVKVTLQS